MFNIKKSVITVALISIIVSLSGCGAKSDVAVVEQPNSWKPVSEQTYILGTILGSAVSGSVTNLDVQVTKLYSTTKNAPIFKVNDKVEFKVANTHEIELKQGDDVVLIQNQVSTDGNSTFFSASIVDYELDGRLVDLQGNDAVLPSEN